jgi:hypothetical protein
MTLRLFLTVWLVYTLHFATDIVRETYLALSLGESFSIRVDKYLGLHPDLFEIPGRGAYINNNPGASFLGAIPYAVARPFIDALLRWKPELAAPKPPTTYDDPRPNRTRFLNEARARGLDIKLGLAAAAIHAGLMVPLGAASAVLMFVYLRRRLNHERHALWLALLYAFATPIFFRSAFLNQNVLIAHALLPAFILATDAARAPNQVQRARWLATGALLGFAILCDYSGVPLAVAFGIWIIAVSWRQRGVTAALRHAGWYTLGAAGPIAILLAYQWAAFGNPFLPAQVYMPATRYSVSGWHGFTLPTAELMWRNLLDPRYGLFAFSPMMVAAFAAPFLPRRDSLLSARELWLIFGTFAALYLFLCSVQFALLQWNTGVRYIVPAVPLLFIALVPVLLQLPRWALLALVIPAVLVSWSVSMMRASVPDSLARLFQSGPELPWLTVLRKTAAGYAPALANDAIAIPILLLAALLLWLLWRQRAAGASR